jgi:hypothetical protein
MSLRDYQREMDLLFQQVMDREEQALMSRYREACPVTDDDEGPAFFRACVDQAVKGGLTGAAAHRHAIEMIQRGLDAGLFLPNGDVKGDS